MLHATLWRHRQRRRVHRAGNRRTGARDEPTFRSSGDDCSAKDARRKRTSRGRRSRVSLIVAFLAARLSTVYVVARTMRRLIAPTAQTTTLPWHESRSLRLWRRDAA